MVYAATVGGKAGEGELSGKGARKNGVARVCATWCVNLIGTSFPHAKLVVYEPQDTHLT